MPGAKFLKFLSESNGFYAPPPPLILLSTPYPPGSTSLPLSPSSVTVPVASTNSNYSVPVSIDQILAPLSAVSFTVTL